MGRFSLAVVDPPAKRDGARTFVLRLAGLVLLCLVAAGFALLIAR